MLDKEIEQAAFVFLNLRHRLQNLVGYEIGAARPGVQAEFLLGPRHDAGAFSAGGGTGEWEE